MKISIITVCYNAGTTLEDTLISVQKQSYNDIEHIVVDGGSTDQSLDVIRKHEMKLASWVSECDDGIYDAMNKGIDIATGDIIGFLNADDVYADNFVLEKVTSTFKDFSCDACYSDLVYVDSQNLSKIIRYIKSCPYKPGLFARGWCPPHPTFFVKKAVYEKFGYFDLSYSIGNDVELMIRFLARSKISSVYLNEIFVKMRIGGVSNRSLGNIIRQNIQILKALRKNDVKVFIPFFLIFKFFSRVTQYYLTSDQINIY